MLNKIFPYPSNFAIVSRQWNMIKHHEGISLVKINVPKMNIPPLPYRREDGKLIFPYGTWVGVYTHPELRMAEQYGVKIIKCYQSLVYNRTFNPFKDYINMFYNLKNISTGIHRDFYKLMLNGLSGKFGEKSYTTIRGKMDNIDICICEHKQRNDKSNMCLQCGKICIDGLLVVPEENNEWVNIIGARLPDSTHTFPILIAYITSYGRIQLYEDRLKYQDAFYADTDSYMGLTEHNNCIGKELGEWERDYMYNFKAHAPKFYTFTKADGDTLPELKLKGVPRKHKVIWICDVCSQKYKDNYCPCCKLELGIKQKRYEFSRPVKLSEAIKRHMKPNRWIKVTKQIAMFDDKRIKHDDGTSEPLYINEATEITTFKDMLKFYKMDTLGI
jgi:ribosomal protein L37AE/L43A